MDGLTDRQREILDYVRGYAMEMGYWPSFREIQKHFGFKSTNAVMGHLRALESKGAIVRVPGQARRIQRVSWRSDALLYLSEAKKAPSGQGARSDRFAGVLAERRENGASATQSARMLLTPR